jgi:ELWxxDGT repeat protein
MNQSRERRWVRHVRPFSSFSSSIAICLFIALAPLPALGQQFVFSLLKDITPGLTESWPSDLVRVGDEIFFAAEDSVHGRELWASDGTSDGTRLVGDIYPGAEGSNPEDLAELAGGVFFEARDSATDWELWSVPSGASGPLRVKDIRPGPIGSFPTRLKGAGDKLYFNASEPLFGSGELWVTDGVSANTHIVKDITVGPGSSAVNEFISFGDRLVFRARDPDGGIKFDLYITDGTEAGTKLILDFDDGADQQGPSGLTSFHDRVFYSVFDPTIGRELWATDGTAGGTALVADFNPLGSSLPRILGSLEEDLLVQATGSGGQKGLWSVDGSTLQSTMLAGFPGDMTWLGTVEQTGLFTADGPTFNDPLSLWKTDGTSGGTELLAEISSISDVPGTYISSSIDFAGHVFFVVNYGDGDGMELWTSNGTSAGTKRVAAGPGVALQNGLAVLDNVLLAAFNSGTHGIGRELFAVTVVPEPQAWVLLAWATSVLVAGRNRLRRQ